MRSIYGHVSLLSQLGNSGRGKAGDMVLSAAKRALRPTSFAAQPKSNTSEVISGEGVVGGSATSVHGSFCSKHGRREGVGENQAVSSA